MIEVQNHNIILNASLGTEIKEEKGNLKVHGYEVKRIIEKVEKNGCSNNINNKLL